MIPARMAAGMVLVGGWHALELLAGRVEGAGLATAIILAAGLFWGLARAQHGVSPLKLGIALLGMAAAGAAGIPMLQIGATTATLLLCASPKPRWPMLALAILALPVLPTLDVLVAGPLRRMSAMLTVTMLQLNGFSVGLDGVVMHWHDQQLLFDGPCSGIRMLWAMLVLTSLIAVTRELSVGRFALLLVIAIIAAVAGNALRAASLFYLEGGFIPILLGPIAHEVVGLVAFTLMAGGILLTAVSHRKAVI